MRYQKSDWLKGRGSDHVLDRESLYSSLSGPHLKSGQRIMSDATPNQAELAFLSRYFQSDIPKIGDFGCGHPSLKI